MTSKFASLAFAGAALVSGLPGCAGYDGYGNARVNPGVLAVGALATVAAGVAIGQATAPRPAPRPYYPYYEEAPRQVPVNCDSIHVVTEYRGYDRSTSSVLANGRVITQHSVPRDAYNRANNMRQQCYNGGLYISEVQHDDDGTPTVSVAVLAP